jgi:hypothetical protein
MQALYAGGSMLRFCMEQIDNARTYTSLLQDFAKFEWHFL